MWLGGRVRGSGEGEGEGGWGYEVRLGWASGIAC